MNRYLFIIRGPENQIKEGSTAASEEDLLKIREWLKGIKAEYPEMLFQKLGTQAKLWGSTGEIKKSLLDQLEGGKIIQLFTLILPDWEKAQNIAESFQFPNEFYSIELRDLI